MTEYTHHRLAAQFAKPSRTVTAQASCEEALQLFCSHKQLAALPVLDGEGRVLGLLRSLHLFRQSVAANYDQAFRHSACTEYMDTNFLFFDAATDMQQMSYAVNEFEEHNLMDGFIVTQNGRYLGLGSFQDLFNAVFKQRIRSAKFANPLTLLPGNLEIEEALRQSLASSRPFVAAYFDLDHFKAFNDVYGHHAGDQLILLAAGILAEAIDRDEDFLGHVGGDDFIVVFRSNDWEIRLNRVLKAFHAQVREHFREEHLKAGGIVSANRRRETVMHPLVSISAGVVDLARIAAAQGSMPLVELSARLSETKGHAKRLGGGRYVIDRRAVDEDRS